MYLVIKIISEIKNFSDSIASLTFSTDKIYSSYFLILMRSRHLDQLYLYNIYFFTLLLFIHTILTKKTLFNCRLLIFSTILHRSVFWWSKPSYFLRTNLWSWFPKTFKTVHEEKVSEVNGTHSTKKYWMHPWYCMWSFIIIQI